MSRPPPDNNHDKDEPLRVSKGQLRLSQQGPPPPNQQYMPPGHEYQYDPRQHPPPPQYGPPQNQPYMIGHENQAFHHGQMMPPSHHTTTVVVNQPVSVTNDKILGPRDGHRDWSTGLFSCCDDVGNCMWGWFCPSCVLADISARLGECVFVTCCIPGGLATIRTRVRTLGGIRGSVCKDYMATEFCSSCVMCQIHRELDYMGL